MEVPRVQVRLGDWTEHCGHPGVVPGLPRLWATVTDEDRSGWGSVAFHWTGKTWRGCEPMIWEVGQAPKPAVLARWAESARYAIGDVSVHEWQLQYGNELTRSLRNARARLERAERRVEPVEDLMRHVRHLECALAAATAGSAGDADAAAVIHRMLGDWSGTPEQLVTTAHAVLGRPE